MNANKKIFLNSSAIYFRTIFSIFLGLFGNRWVLSSLGEVDYGIFSVINTIIVIMIFLNTVTTLSVTRYLSYNIHKKFEEISQWFNTSLFLHLILSLLVVFFGYIIGQYILKNILTIPTDKRHVCTIIFNISLFYAFFSIISVPFKSLFIAKQNISELMFWEILQSLLLFISAYLLIYAKSNHLLIYGIYVSFIRSLTILCQILRGFFLYSETKINLRHCIDLRKMRSLFNFSSWSIFGTLGGLFRNQGSVILINYFYGPSLNASFSIADQISTQTNNISSAFLNAFSPEMSSREGQNDRKGMLSLSIQCTRFSMLLILMIVLPLYTELEYILKVWLLTVPDYSEIFCKLMLIAFTIDRSTSGYMLAVNAHGNISGYQTTLGLILISTPLISLILIKLLNTPTTIGWSIVLTTAMCSIGRLYWAKKILDLNYSIWLKDIFRVFAFVIILTYIINLLLITYLKASFFRLLIITQVDILILIIYTWNLLKINEKKIIQSIVLTWLKKLRS